MISTWKYLPLSKAAEICDNLRKPINSKERNERIAGKSVSELFPYYGATGQVGYIDDYITDGEYVLLGEDGAPFLSAFAEKAYIINGKTWVNNHAHILKSHTSNKFLCYYLNSFNFKGYVSGTTRLKLTQASMKQIMVPVPPLEEQHRIVTRIEELFSQLDSGIETLKKTKEQLKVYRQAVLKEAFESASSSNSKNLTINDLLTKKKKGMTTGPFGTMLKKHEHQSSGVPVLGIENIGKDGFVDGNKIFVSEEKAKELSAFKVDTDDLIISRSGTVGEICIVPPHMKNALLSTNLMRISLDYDVIRADYFMYLFKSKGVVIDQVKELCKGSTRMFLNQTILKQIIFPVPTLKIQAKIIETIESRLSVCDSIEKTIDTALQEAEALRQSILKQAFEGGL